MESAQKSVDEILKEFSTNQENQSGQTFSNLEYGKSSDEILREKEELENSQSQQNNEDPEKVETIVNQEEELTESDFKAIDLLIKEGKLLPLEDESGNLVKLETKGDLLELLDRNQEYYQQTSYEIAQKQFYENKSPVWQALLQYAEDARDINEIAPLFNAISDIQKTDALDLEVIENQEEILRMYGSLQGLDAKTIDEDIEDLKERGKLKDRALSLKSTIEKYHESQANALLAKKQQEEIQRNQLIQQHYNTVVEKIIKPQEVGGFKLSNEHKQLIASTLIPDPKIGGLPIYAIIDNLVQSGNFDILSKIALLALDSKNFDNYYSSRVGNEVATNLQRHLRTANSRQNSNGTIIASEQSNKPLKKQELEKEQNFYFAH